MTRIITVLVLVAVLAGLAITEQTCIEKVYDKMKAETEQLITLVKESPDPKETDDEFDQYIVAKVNELHRYWMKKEKDMSVLIKHIDLSYVSDALVYAKNFIEFGNQEEAMAGLLRLKYLLDTYSHVYGLNLTNIL